MLTRCAQEAAVERHSAKQCLAAAQGAVSFRFLKRTDDFQYTMKAFEIADVPRDEVDRFVRGLHSDPFSVLGPHKVGDEVEIRVFRPDARTIEVVLDRDPGKPIVAKRIDE